MRNILEKYLWKVLRKADPAFHNAKSSWSQQGEDLIIDFIFSNYLNCSTPSYLDIGANHPFRLSNTYYFYKKGSKGVNIEPDPSLFNLLEKYRPEDKNLNIGISNLEEVSEVDFYMMSSSTLNTFSKSTALQYTTTERLGKPSIIEVKKIKVLPINQVLQQYFRDQKHYFITIDVEGLDLEVLCSIDFEIFRPDVICVETDFASTQNIDSYKEYLKGKRYSHYAENSINSIFINTDTVDL